MQLIINKRRIYFLDKILEKYIKLCSKKKGKLSAILISSKELSQDERKKLNQDISKAIKSNIDFIFKTDKNLIKWNKNTNRKFVDRHIGK